MPTAALGKTNATDQPYNVTGSGTAINTRTSLLTSYETVTGSVRGTHIGNATYEGQAWIFITGFNSLFRIVSNPITTAKGEQLYTSGTGTGTFTPECIGAGDGCVVTIQTSVRFTGGTGRFEDASGSAKSTIRTVRTSTDGTTSTYSSEWKSVGTISY